MIFATWLGTGYGHIDEDGVLVDGEIEYGTVREESVRAGKGQAVVAEIKALCRNCSHWERIGRDGICGRLGGIECSVVPDNDGLGVDFYTRENFGCVLFEVPLASEEPKS